MSAEASIELKLIERQQNESVSKKLEDQGISAMLSQLFSARGVQDVSDVRAKISDLHPISTLKNAPEMGRILADIVESRDRILIVSDYDCDGATACSILIRAFQGAKMNFDYLIPDRMKHGYGLTPSIVDEAAALPIKPKFIITVDNGISSNPGVDRARELGIEVLVTDHHLCPAVLPNAKLIVNPQQPGDDFKSKAIAGCGVAWYVAAAMFQELSKRKIECTFRPVDLLPFVALGTVADLVQMDRNNRILVKEGLDRIRRGECSAGINALTAVSGKVIENLSCQDIGFGLAPRINAAGRLAHMSVGIQCLTTKDRDEATNLAFTLNETNEERKAIQKKIAEEADKLSLPAENVTNPSSVVVFEPSWHEGVVGIVASRMKDQHFRPSFVLTSNHEGEIKGSGRSIPGFHLKHALDRINVEHPGVLLKFGGHAMAAGVTIHPDSLATFKDAFERVCREELTKEMLIPRLEHDGAFPSFAFNQQTIHELQREVWGQGFPEPIFVDSFPIKGAKTMGSDHSHLKLVVRKGENTYDMVAFGQGDAIARLPDEVEVAFKPSLNEWNGKISVQLMSEKLLNVPEPKLQATAEKSIQEEAIPEKPSVKGLFKRL